MGRVARPIVPPPVAWATAAGAAPGGSGPAEPAAAPVTFALLGDTPYGDAQRAQFPALVDAVNADPAIRFVLHAGDIKNGPSTCDDARFADLAALYDTFAHPFVLTPGDNEWTDCHRTTAGGYQPARRAEGGAIGPALPYRGWFHRRCRPAAGSTGRTRRGPARRARRRPACSGRCRGRCVSGRTAPTAPCHWPWPSTA